MGGHTPTPWRNQCFQVLGPRGEKIAHTGMGQRPPSESDESEANARFIVEAVNSYEQSRQTIEALVGALELARARIEVYGVNMAHPRHAEHDAKEILPKIDSALLLAGEKNNG